MADPQSDPVAEYLRTIPVSDQIRAQAWDAVHGASTDDDLTMRLQALPVDKTVRAQLFDLKPAIPQTFGSKVMQAQKDELGGVRAGLASLVFKGGDVIRRATGMDRVIDRPAVQAAMQMPDSMAGKLGHFAEQVGEFAVPASRITEGVKASGMALKMIQAGIAPARALLATGAAEGVAQGGAAYGLTKLHGDEGAGLAGAVSAVAPVATKSLELYAPVIRQAAQTKLARLLATGIEDKGHGALIDYALKSGTAAGDAVRGSVDKATKIVRDAAAELLDLPVNASWGKWQTMLASRTESAKQFLGTALKGKFGDTEIPTAPIVAELDGVLADATRHFARLAGNTGNAAVTYDAPLFKELTALKDQLGTYDNTITARNLVDIKRVWDKTVYTLATSGKVNADPSTLISSAMKDAAFTGANAIRRALDENAPTIAKLNEAVSHAIRLEDLVKKVAVAHPGLSEATKTITQGAATAGGGVAGQMLFGHWWAGSTAGLAATRILTKAIESPLWHTATPKMKNALAQAIQQGNADAVRNIVAPIVSASVTGPAQ